MIRQPLGPLRRLDLLLIAAVIGSASVVPTVSAGQGAGQQPPSGPRQSTGAAGGNQSSSGARQGNRNRANRRTSRAANQGLSVVPVTSSSSQTTGPVSGLPPGAKVQNGPDGKPMVVGADGKPLMGPDGKPFPVPGPAPAIPGGPTGTGRAPNMFDNIIPPSPGANPTGGFGGNGFGRNTFGDLSAGGTITMDFRGSDIQNVLKFFAMATNWQIVPDATLTGPVTIISPKPLTIDQAFQVLQSTLEIRGFSGQLEKRGDTTILRILPFDRAVQSGNNVVGTDAQGNTTGLTPEQLKNLRGQVITQVIPVENVDASALSRELKELTNKGASLVASTGTNALIVTDTASNVQRIMDLVKMLDRAASNSQIQIFALQHSDATDITSVINSLFGRVFGRGGGGAPGGQPGQPGQPQVVPGQGGPGGPGGPGGGNAGGQQRAAVIATADTRTNSVIVVASDENMKRVADLIQRLDDPTAAALDTKIVKMQYADALDIADTINSILSNSTLPSANNRGASFQQRVFGGGGFGGFGGFGGGGQQPGGVASTDPFARVVGNARTNSLVVTATKEKMEKIDELIRELDVPVAVESTTFVIPLKNAQAQDIATILGQAFGTSNSGGGFGGFGGGFNIFGNNNNNQRRNGINGAGTINRRTTTGGGGGFGRSNEMSPSSSIEDPEGMPGTLTPDGKFVPDANAAQSRAAQFFPGGFGGFGGGRGQQLQTPLYGRGRNGQQVNLTQFRQNVGVVADPATNSLVITTTPDNLPFLKQIIDSLDVVPRQVLIEVIIAEASLDASQKLGVQFDAQGVGKILGSAGTQTTNSNFPLGTSGSTLSNINGAINPGFQFGVQALSGRYRALVQALATDNRVRILSTPKVFTSNNQQGLIDITTQVPYVTGAQQNSIISTGTNITTQFLDVGIQLQVTPRIARDGLVTMDVVTTASELLGFDTLTASLDANGRPQTIVAPRTSSRSTDTSVSVRDGEVVVLGGLMRDTKTSNVNKIPLLGDIPIIGHLFRSTSNSINKTELMIFLIPHVVDSDASNRAVVDGQSTNIRKAFPDLEKQQPALKPQPLDPNKPADDRPQPPTQPVVPSQPIIPPGAKTDAPPQKSTERPGFDK